VAGGAVFATVAMIVAFALNGRCGPSKTALPYAQQKIGRDLLFTLCLPLSLAMKMFGMFGLLSVALGMIPPYLIIKGYGRET
jgi:hypothetical protein